MSIRDRRRGHMQHQSASSLATAIYGLEIVYYAQHLGHIESLKKLALSA